MELVMVPVFEVDPDLRQGDGVWSWLWCLYLRWILTFVRETVCGVAYGAGI
ncbi:hypothetical protein PCIT_b0400 [Pseudoalteromonas citrea]|uniref:Uncharacterized protein n=1 Tax=Pseudoalteromonas citrea TaxID=43655 RepID=A0AAD4AEC2_9GAMM|nr:hypothetical protein PCIT_b0400 [Pseudoalteromonas citrea]